MAILSGLCASAPSGFWANIIKSFETSTGSYILAIILLTVIIRVIWGLVDTLTKYTQAKQTLVQSKMQPELDRLQAKYEKQPEVFAQKRNEVYQRYYGKGYYGSCIIMLVVMILNMIIFFTLFSSLNAFSSYKIINNYEGMKYDYANGVSVVKEYFGDNFDDEIKKANFADYQNLEIVIGSKKVVEDSVEKDVKVVYLVKWTDKENDQKEILAEKDYLTDFSYKKTVEGEDGQTSETTVLSNNAILEIVNSIIPTYGEGEEYPSKEVVIKTETSEENGEVKTTNLYLSQAVQSAVMGRVKETYKQTKESFLWIDNIWIADSPMTKSIINYSSLKAQYGKKVEENEELVYNTFMNDLKATENRVNGYFIVPALIVLLSILSMNINKWHNARKLKKQGRPAPVNNAKWMQIILPLILGMFAIFYNSVFAIYMLVGQIVSTILLPLQLFVVEKIMEKKDKKSEPTVVDYARKF